MRVDHEYVKQLPVGVRHVDHGLAVVAPSIEAIRVKRYLLLGGAQDIAAPYFVERTDSDTGEIAKRSEFRVSCCMRSPVDKDKGVSFWRNEERVGFAGLMRCGNVWSCPLCCAKVMGIREKQIRALFDGVLGADGSALMVTFTAAHTADDSLADLLAKFKRAQQSMSRSREYRRLIEARAGAVVATEIMYGRSGWHPHQHHAWFYLFSPGPDVERLARDLYVLWAHHAGRQGLKVLRQWRGRNVGVDVREAWGASEYLTKFDRERDWGLDAELTAGRLKGNSGGSVTAWGLLETAICRGNASKAWALFVEYMRATKGKASVSLKAAKDLCARFDVDMNVDDFADANKAGESEIFATLASASFDRVVRNGGLGNLLEAARSRGLSGVVAAATAISNGCVYS